MTYQIFSSLTCLLSHPICVLRCLIKRQLVPDNLHYFILQSHFLKIFSFYLLSQTVNFLTSLYFFLNHFINFTSHINKYRMPKIRMIIMIMLLSVFQGNLRL